MPEPTATLTAAQAREVDKLCGQAGIPVLTLMENAGRGAAEWVLQNLRPRTALLLCGTGNNGGDGLVCARLLAAQGVACRIILFGEPARYTPAAAANAARLGAIPLDHAAEDLSAWPAAAPDIIVDAVFGTGFSLSRPIAGALALHLAHAATLPSTKIAMDIPTGTDADTGQSDPATLACDHTLTFVAPKAGMATPNGASRCGASTP